MTLREACELNGIDDDPFGCAFIIAALLRTVAQREPSTFEGECASLVKATEVYGPIDDPATIRRWLDALNEVPDLPVPDSLWLSICNADGRNEQSAT